MVLSNSVLDLLSETFVLSAAIVYLWKRFGGLFLGILYVRERGVVGLRQWCGRLPVGRGHMFLSFG